MNALRITMPTLDFPGVVLTCTPEVLIVYSQQPLQVLSSAVVGGGFIRARYLLNRHVHRDYNDAEPEAEFVAFARERGITEAFVGQMTAVSLHKARVRTVRARTLTVAVVVTAGVSNATTPGLSPPAMTEPGTINMILLIDARLTPAAMVNAVIMATEIKTQTLMARGIQTPEGDAATGTSTDAIAVACTGRGTLLPYAGPVTLVGWLIGRCVRSALADALAQG
jgi:adenosylcobinamide hydrolase